MKNLWIIALLFTAQLIAQEDTSSVAAVDTNVVAMDSTVAAVDSTIADSTKIVSVVGKTSVAVSVHADSLIDFQRAENKEKCPDIVRGYKVQIYSCAGTGCQEKADKIYHQFVIAFPDIPAEIVWEAPSYKVRVGNCRNRFEAEGIRSRIRDDFPFIYLVPDYIQSEVRLSCDEMK